VKFPLGRKKKLESVSVCFETVMTSTTHRTQRRAGKMEKGCFGKFSCNDGVGICVNSWMMFEGITFRSFVRVVRVTRAKYWCAK
jgi:hypothetical protein